MKITDGQMNIYDFLSNKTAKPIEINKPIRLIETFAGYGSQAMALKRMDANFEHHKISEWEINAVKSYKAVHMPDDNTDFSKEVEESKLADLLFQLGISNDGKKPMTLEAIKRKGIKWQKEVYNAFRATNNLGSITNIKGKDLNIQKTDEYCYIMSYSFPCTNLSLAGKQAGMKKGSNTSSSLLWEIERIFNEIKDENLEFPQILVMENVPQVISAKHKPDFDEWIAFLESLGYSNFYQVINAKDYGIAQNRKRCFMISILGEYTYEFPNPIPLKKKLKDFLELNVPESYYVDNEKTKKLIATLLNDGTLTSDTRDDKTYLFKNMSSVNRHPNGEQTDIARCLQARDYKGFDNYGTNGIIDFVLYDDFNRRLKSDQATTGTVMPNFGCSALGNGNKIIEIGNLNEKDTGFTNPQTGRVYSTEGISPTLNTCGGGQREPKIIVSEDGTKCLNSKGGRNGIDGLQPSIQDRVYDTNGCMTAITTSFMPSILEEKGVIIDDTQGFEDEPRVYDEYAPSLRASRSGLKTIDIPQTIEEKAECIVAMRGRNPENPLDRTVGSPTEQRLEPNNKGLCNTLTTVQKDNMVLEEIKVLGNYMESNHDASRIVSTEGLAPTVKENHGTITGIVDTINVKQATKQGYIECEVGGVADLSYPTSTKRRGRVQGGGHICPTLTTSPEEICHFEKSVYQYCYRIRKLTERECGRLMAVSDEDITKMQKVNSKSQLYKQYGNSIVVNCLIALFSQLGIGTIPRWNDGLYKILEE